MNIEFRLFIIGMLLVVTTMAVATQFAITDIQYEYEIIIPVIPDYGIKYIGSDNSSDGIRVLRAEQNGTDSYKIRLGNISMNYHLIYTAAFGIVNEDMFTQRITHIEVPSSTATYLKIWLHGDRDCLVDNNSNDPTSVLLYDNGTIESASNTVAWTLAPGDGNASTICSNITDRSRYTSSLSYDEIAKIRYSYDNNNACSSFSDFVWIQIDLKIPDNAELKQANTGYFYIYLKSD